MSEFDDPFTPVEPEARGGKGVTGGRRATVDPGQYSAIEVDEDQEDHRRKGGSGGRGKGPRDSRLDVEPACVQIRDMPEEDYGKWFRITTESSDHAAALKKLMGRAGVRFNKGVSFDSRELGPVVRFSVGERRARRSKAVEAEVATDEN